MDRRRFFTAASSTVALSALGAGPAFAQKAAAADSSHFVVPPDELLRHPNPPRRVRRVVHRSYARGGARKIKGRVKGFSPMGVGRLAPHHRPRGNGIGFD